jgi:hypothetical protein
MREAAKLVGRRRQTAENTVQTKATSGVFARGEKLESAARLAGEIENAQNIGSFSDRVAVIEILSRCERAGMPKFA